LVVNEFERPEEDIDFNNELNQIFIPQFNKTQKQFKLYLKKLFETSESVKGKYGNWEEVMWRLDFNNYYIKSSPI